ncbi:class I SAM-dependent methyltransferase [Alphaproteobacteria bacterium]|nr:class I SAM-dependent methyltransferase [Alphaproteobacteria bacterium]
MYKTIKSCRICYGAELTTVFDLGNQALTGVFPKSINQNITNGPVQLVKCTSQGGCGLVQLKQSYDVCHMYGLNYGYRSGLNPTMVKHLHEKVAKVVSAGILSEDDLVIDIGSNDATTLRSFPSGRFQLVGIDPTGIKFSGYYPSDIRLISDFFTKDIINKNLGDVKAKVITSFSMFYDLEDPVQFAREVSQVLADDGLWIMEQSYMPTMLKSNSFDTICHEHLEFYALSQIKFIVEKVGMKIKDVEFNDINGGSFSVEIIQQNSTRLCNDALIKQVLDSEKEMGLSSDLAFSEFRERISLEQDKLITFLEDCKKNGKRVAGLGASTKGNVLLQYYNLNSSLIAEIGEINEEKFGCYTPRTNIPLVPETEMLANNPEYILVLPWHFREFFLSLERLKGKKLVFALPYFQIVEC